MQDKRPINAKGQLHGIWEEYYDNGQLWYKGTFINGIEHGPWITYYDTGQLMFKRNYNLGKLDGLCQWYNKDGSIMEMIFYAR